jgi:hypothetical protein
LKEGRLRVHLNHGDPVITQKLFMTRHQSVGALQLADGRILSASVDLRPTISLHLRVKTSTPARAAFVLAKKDPSINLVSDLTSFTEGVPSGERIIVLRLHRQVERRDRAAAEESFGTLVEWGFFTSPAELLDFHFSEFPYRVMSNESVTAWESSGVDGLTIFRSSNFSNSIADQVPRWREE